MELEVALGVSELSFLLISSASLSLRLVALEYISSSLEIVEKVLGKSSSLVLLTISIRLILIGSLKGESIRRLISVCLFRSGITLTLSQ